MVLVSKSEFDAVLAAFEGLGEVKERNVKGQDITDNYIDLEARLSSYRSEDERLVDILEMSVNVEEMLVVESEPRRVRGEVERLTGEITYMEGRVDLATISVSLIEASVSQNPRFPQVDWSVPVRSGLQMLVIIIQGAVAMTIFLGPLAAVIVPVYYTYTGETLKEKREKKKSGARGYPSRRLLEYFPLVTRYPRRSLSHRCR